MTNQQDKNKKHYFDLLAESEYEKALTELVKQPENTLTTWIKGNEEVVEEYLPTRYDKDQQTIYLRRKGNFIDRIVGSDFINQEILVKFVIDRYKYFLTAKLFFSPEAKEFKIRISGDFYKSQQRANYRLECSEDNVVKVKVAENCYPGLDISTGGTSIEIPACDQEIFPKGKVLTHCELTYNHIIYKVPAMKVMGVFVHLDEKGLNKQLLKIGLSFISLTKASEGKLYQQINTQIRKEEVKKRLDEA